MTLESVAQRVEMDGYGPPDVLRWREVRLGPVPAGEVRLRTVAAAVNRADVEIRKGAWPVQREDPFPYTPGLEAVGVVEEVGEGVAEPAVGQLAITMMQRLGGIHGVRPGGYSELVTVPAASVAVLPNDVDAHAVAALGLAAVTALEGLRRAGVRPGGHLVVLGASGGVGSAAVALASRTGADVIAVVSRGEQANYARSLGAAQVVVLGRGARLVELLGARTADGVLETLGARTFADSVAVLRAGGQLCSVGALTGPELTLSAWDLLQDLHLTGWSSENLTGDELRADVTEIVAALQAGDLPAPQWQTLPMAQAAEAHRLLESGGVPGRLLLVPG